MTDDVLEQEPQQTDDPLDALIKKYQAQKAAPVVAATTPDPLDALIAQHQAKAAQPDALPESIATPRGTTGAPRFLEGGVTPEPVAKPVVAALARPKPVAAASAPPSKSVLDVIGDAFRSSGEARAHSEAASLEGSKQTGDILMAPAISAAKLGLYVGQKINDIPDARIGAPDHSNEATDNELASAMGVPQISDREGLASAAQLAAIGFAGPMIGKLAGKVTARGAQELFARLSSAEPEVQAAAAEHIGKIIGHGYEGATIGAAYDPEHPARGAAIGAGLGVAGGIAGALDAPSVRGRGVPVDGANLSDNPDRLLPGRKNTAEARVATEPSAPEGPDYTVEGQEPKQPPPSGGGSAPAAQRRAVAPEDAAPTLPEVESALTDLKAKAASATDPLVQGELASRINMLEAQGRKLRGEPEPEVATAAAARARTAAKSGGEQPAQNVAVEDAKSLAQNEVANDEHSTVAPVTEPAKKHDYSSTQIDLPQETADHVRTMASAIPDEDLAEKGREDAPHVTVKYGLHGEDPEKVRALLADVAPISVTLGKTSIFPDGESKNGDVVKLDVDSPELHDLNKKIADALPHTDTHPGYKPHATVAYVKPGLGKKYAGNGALEGHTVMVDRITFSSKDGTKTEIPLGGQKVTPSSDNAIAAARAEDAVRTVPAEKDPLDQLIAQHQESVSSKQNGMPTPEGGVTIKRMPVADIIADPERFQYKHNGDEESGAGAELKGLQKFDEQLAGVVSVWRDPATGIVHPINGHNRLAFAKRVGHPSINVQELEAKTAADARAQGAIANIAEGRGTPLDAARFFRDAKMTPEDLADRVSVKGAIMRHGVNLSRLAPDLFSKVETGELSESHGSAIGEVLTDPAQQRAAASAVAGKRLSEGEVKDVARQVRDAGSENVQQDSLFGQELTNIPLYVEKAQLATLVKRRLAQDKKLFGFVAKGSRAEELARAGNVIEKDKSQAIADQSAQLEEMFSRLYTTKGPISDALTQAAREVANGAAPKSLIESIYPAIRDAISASFGGGEGGRAPAPGAAGSIGQPAASEGLRASDAEDGRVKDSEDPSQNAMFERGPRYDGVAERGADYDLFGGEEPKHEEEFGLFGGDVGKAAAPKPTEGGFSAKQKEARARADFLRKQLDRIRNPTDFYGNKKPRGPVTTKERQLAAELAQLERIAGFDQKISAEELKARATAGENDRLLEEGPKYNAGEQVPETGKPFTFSYIHNTEKAPNVGDTYGQHIEPAGRYMQQHTGTPPEGKRWKSGTVTFERPLVIPFGGGYQDQSNWKYELSRKYGGRKGKALSQAIRDDGYDGIVTMERGHTSEIVDLSRFKPEVRDLIIQHNVTGPNILHAVRMGGIPVPSLAITKHDQAITGFGDITLLGDRKMADPKGYANTKVFGADIYSPRYPKVSYQVQSKALSALSEAWADASKATGEAPLWHAEMNLNDEGPRELENSASAMKVFLDGKGIHVPLPDIPRGDHYIAQRALRSAIDEHKLGDAFLDFVNETFQSLNPAERLFNGFTYGGNRRYKPHTLENVVAILKKQMRGGEGFNYGPGSLRAHFTPQFRSIAQIKAAKDKLVSREAFEKLKEEINDDLFAIANELAPHSNRGKEFGFVDTVMAVMEDAPKMGITRALKEYGMTDIPEETKQKIGAFMNHLRNMPTEYFEAKITREVDLAEFKAAVVPEGTSRRVIEALEKRGVKIVTYPKGDEAARRQAISEAAHAHNTVFEKGPKYESGVGDHTPDSIRALGASLPPKQAKVADILDGVAYRMQHDAENWRNALDALEEDEFARDMSYTPEELDEARKLISQNRPSSRVAETAFHGSPHEFEKFSLHHVGTGEGNQSFGWGLYFAGKKALAAHYRDTLAERAPLSEQDAVRLFDAMHAMPKYRRDGRDNEIAGFAGAMWTKAKLIRAFKTGLLRPNEIPSDVPFTSGKLYTVDIPGDDELLHWDKPLADQPPKVKAALESLARPQKRVADMTREELIALLKKVDRNGAYTDEESIREMGYPATREDLLQAAENMELDEYLADQKPSPRQTGSGQYDQIVAQFGSPKAASEALSAAGVHGINYLNGVSRNLPGAPSGDPEDYNYVIFDDSKVHIKGVEERGQTYKVDPAQQEMFAQDAIARPNGATALKGRREEAKIGFGSIAKRDAALKPYEDVFKKLAARNIPTTEARQTAIAKFRQENPLGGSVKGLRVQLGADESHLAKVMDMLRDPLMEHFNAIYLGKRGRDGKHEIIHHESDTVGALSFATVPDARIIEIAETAKRLGAIVVLGHNHPSGEAFASRDDIMLTMHIDALLKAKGVELHSHIVIDHNEYASINPNGTVWNGVRFEAKPAAYETGKESGRASIESPHGQEMAGLLHEVTGPNHATIIVVDVQNRIVGVSPRPLGHLLTIDSWLPQLLETTGGNGVFIAAPEAEAKLLAKRAGDIRRANSEEHPHVSNWKVVSEASWAHDILDILATDPRSQIRYRGLANSYFDGGADTDGIRSSDFAKGEKDIRRTVGEPKASKVSGNARAVPEIRSGEVAETAFHGTPHEFDRFSLQHIGSGEGNQSYGWGMYFAGKRDLAQWYRENLSERQFGSKLVFQALTPQENKLIPAWVSGTLRGTPHNEKTAAADKLIADFEKRVTESAASGSHNDRGNVPGLERIVVALKKLRDSDNYVQQPAGKLYTVDIPDDDTMLHWDKPLSEQPDKVKAAIEASGPAITPNKYPSIAQAERQFASPVVERDAYNDIGTREAVSAGWSRLMEWKNQTESFKAHPSGYNREDMEKAEARFKAWFAKDGGVLNSTRRTDITGERFYQETVNAQGAKHNKSIRDGAPELASKLLLSHGITGIKYLNGQSRSAGKGDYNYVVFDDNHVSIKGVEERGPKYDGSEEAPAEEEEPQVGIKNADSAAQRERMGLDERIRQEPRTQDEMYEAGKRAIAADPTAAARILTELAADPEKIVGTQEEAGILLKHRVDLENKFNRLLKAKDDAVTDGDAEAERLARLQLGAHREEMTAFIKLMEQTGTATGRALAARKMMSKLDYSLGTMEAMSEAAKGQSLTEAELARVRALHDELQEKLAAVEKDAIAARERAAQVEAELHHAQLKLEVAGPLADRITAKLETAAEAAMRRIKARGLRASAGMDPIDLADHAIIGAAAIARGARKFAAWSDEMVSTFGEGIAPHLDEIFAEANKKLDEEIAGMRPKAEPKAAPAADAPKRARKGRGSDEILEALKERIALDGELEPAQLQPYLQQMALAYIRAGVTEREPLLDRLHRDVQQAMPEATREEVRDALSGYGQFYPLDKSADKVRLREIKAESQKLAQLEALQRGEAPLATGLERQSPNDETRRLTKVVNDAKKAAGIVSGMDQAARLKSALGAAKTRTRNAINDLQTEIDTGNRMVKGKSTLLPDAELTKLREQLAELRRQEKEVFGTPTMSPEQRLRLATASAKRNAIMWNDRLVAARRGEFAPDRKPPLATPEIEALRAQAKAAREAYNELAALDPTIKAKEDAKANATYRRILAQREADLLDRMAKQDYAPRLPKPARIYDAETMKRKADVEELKTKFQDEVRKWEKANRSLNEKAQDAAVAYVRAGALSWPTVLFKLSSVALSRIVTTPLVDMVAVGVAKSLPALAKGAPRHGNRSFRVALRAEAAAQVAMFTDGMRDAGRMLRNKQSSLTLLYGKHKMPHEWYEYMGSLHGALKEPIKRAEFARSLYLRTVEAMERGEDTTSPFVQLRLATEAYKDAERAIAMVDNKITSGWNSMIRGLEAKEKATGRTDPALKLLSTALKVEMPIVKAPTNVVIDASEYIYGSLYGPARAAWHYYKGIEDLKPVERDAIIRQISKGLVGAAFMLLAYFKRDELEFGGFYQKGEHRKATDVPAGGVRIHGKIIPKMWLHNPLFLAGNYAATIARLAPLKHHKKDKDPVGLWGAFVAANVGLMEEIPIVGSLVRDLEDLKDGATDMLAKKMANVTVPGAVQWVAAKMDDDKKRKPVGLKQNYEVRLPGLRDRVPLAKQQ